MIDAFAENGWVRFDSDPAVLDWVSHALPAAKRAVSDPRMAHWLQCDGTWFVGVDALPNDARGRINGSGVLSGAAADFIASLYGSMPLLHYAQLSVVYPGYPRPRAGESETAFRFRQNRDAAHVDGVLAVGKDRRRYMQEPHLFILGIPLTEAALDASPLVVWEGSHEIMRKAFERAFGAHDPATWSTTDVTDIYTQTRRHVFETCPRIELPSKPGQAVLLHRFLVHGVAPWATHATADPAGRMIAYFRPEVMHEELPLFSSSRGL